jgi:hypothetical protein
MKFYPADWQADEGLRQCSLASRGLWIEMIAMMHKSAVYGHLLIAGVAPTEQQIAMAVGADLKSVKAGITELESWRVFSRNDAGVIYSRRMISDAEKAKRDRDNGSGGGNPKLRVVSSQRDNKGVNPPINHRAASEVKPPDNGVDKAQILDARYQKPEEENRSLRSLPQIERAFDEFWAAYPRKKGKEDARKRFAAVLKRFSQAEIMLGLSRQVWNADPNFIPHPATWLNQGRWMDEPDQPAPKSSTAMTAFERRKAASDAVLRDMCGEIEAAEAPPWEPDLLALEHHGGMQ